MSVMTVAGGELSQELRHVLKLWPVLLSSGYVFSQPLGKCISCGKPAKLKLETLHGAFGRVSVWSFTPRTQLSPTLFQVLGQVFMNVQVYSWFLYKFKPGRSSILSEVTLIFFFFMLEE